MHCRLCNQKLLIDIRLFATTLEGLVFFRQVFLLTGLRKKWFMKFWETVGVKTKKSHLGVKSNFCLVFKKNKEIITWNCEYSALYWQLLDGVILYAINAVNIDMLSIFQYNIKWNLFGWRNSFRLGGIAAPCFEFFIIVFMFIIYLFCNVTN